MKTHHQKVEHFEVERLIVQAQCGDLSAYDEIVRRFQDMAVAYGCHLLNDSQRAEDAA